MPVASWLACLLFAGALFPGVPVSALAQAQAQTPPPTLPGAVEQGTFAVPDLDIPDLETSFAIELPGGQDPPLGSAETLIPFEGIRIEGLSVFPQESIEALYRDRIGEEITVAALFTIAQKVSQRLRQEGYVLSYAFFEPQTVSDGVYTLTVIEGFIDRVEISGIEGGMAQRVQRTLQPVIAERPLRLGTLERAVKLVNALPGIRAKSVLRRAEETDRASTLLVSATDDPIEATMSVNNLGTGYVGPWMAKGSVTVNDTLGLGEALTLKAGSAFEPSEGWSLGADWEQTLGSNGTKLFLGTDFQRQRPGQEMRAYDITTTITSLTLEVTHPLILERENMLMVSGWIGALDLRMNYDGAKLVRDRLRAFQLSGEYAFTDPLGGVSDLSLAIRQGLPALGATRSGSTDYSRDDAVADYTVGRMHFRRWQPLLRGVTLYTYVQGQWARTPLPAPEELSVGGPTIGYGYDRGEIMGDDGIAATAELTYSLPVGRWGLDLLTPYLRYDFGAVWDKTDAVDDAQTLSSVGGGLRVQMLGGKVDMEFGYGQPLTRPPRAAGNDGGRPGRYSVEIKTNF